MHNLNVDKSKYTVQVAFDAENGVLELAGSSYPENAAEFYQPIFVWLKEFVASTGKPYVVNLKFNYLNTSSSKCILDLLDIISRHGKQGGQVTVNWYYDKNDEDMLECGNEYSEDADLQFTMIPY
jgi:hypothetical protein